MSPYYEDELVTIYHGDSRDILPHLPLVDVVITDPPYSSGRQEGEFAATGNVAVCLHLASRLAPTMMVFGTSSARGIEFICSSIREIPHNRVLAWHRSYVNSPAAGPWRWDLVLIHVFGKGSLPGASMEGDGRVRYKAQEREWVKRILARLTPEQRERYEAECKTAPRHRNGKLYDEARARIAERIMYEDRMEADA